MKREPLLSVVIPIYKVEKYLEVCIESVLSQTYKNLEIILVDDGSPDSCPEICDRYRKKDNRIYVVHQENRGLSEARNQGIDIANGDLITFLDSDDLIAPNMYKNMIEKVIEYDVDIVTCGVQNFYNEEEIIFRDEKERIQIYSNIDVLKKYLYEQYNIHVVACNKVYRREIFKSLRYPKGKLFEDFVPITKAIISSKKILVMDNQYYFYRKRDDSINGENFIKPKFNKKVMDLADAIDEVFDIIGNYDRRLLNYILPAGLKAKISIVNQMVNCNCIDMNYVKSIQKEIHQYQPIIKSCDSFGKFDKIKILLLKNLNIYIIFYYLYKVLKKIIRLEKK